MSNSFFSYMQNGGVIRVANRGPEFKLVGEVGGSQTPAAQVRLTSGSSTSRYTVENIWKSYVDFFGGNYILAWAVLLGALATVLGLIVLAIIMLRPDSERGDTGMVSPVPAHGLVGANLQQPPAGVGPSSYGGQHQPVPRSSFEPSTRPASSGSGNSSNKETVIMPGAGMMGAAAAAGGGQNVETLAWLQRVDNNQRIAVKGKNLHIGRGDDSDIRFDATTVHRRHANLHMTPKREFIITDLSGDGGNGIKINSTKIANKATLNDGDMLEIGEIKLRFHRASA